MLGRHISRSWAGFCSQPDPWTRRVPNHLEKVCYRGISCIRTEQYSGCRVTTNGKSGSATSRFRLPSLRPPTDGLLTLLSIPRVARLHCPISMYFMIRYHHPTRSVNITVQLDPDPTDWFVVVGIRNGRVPILLPGAEERLTWQLILLECGHIALPHLKVMDRCRALGGVGFDAEEESQGDMVKVVDVREMRLDQPLASREHSMLEEAGAVCWSCHQARNSCGCRNAASSTTCLAPLYIVWPKLLKYYSVPSLMSLSFSADWAYRLLEVTSNPTIRPQESWSWKKGDTVGRKYMFISEKSTEFQLYDFQVLNITVQTPAIHYL